MGVITPLQVDSRGNPLQTGHLKEMGKDEFLQLLVAKLTHQDPLEPMKDEAFIADLAQFSSLEQLSNLNDSINASLDMDYLQMQTINNTMATSLIGKEVQTSSNYVYLDDDNLPQISFSNTEYAADITVNIKNMDGTVVRTISEHDFAIGNNSIVWDGKDANGRRLENDFYSVEITGVDANGNVINPSTYMVGRVTGVVYHDGAAFLTVNGVEVPLAEVSSISEPSEDSSDETDDQITDNDDGLLDEG